MSKFQVELAGEWTDYTQTEDRILKRSYMAGFPNCRFSLRGASYEYSFERMVQKNLTTGKERKIRAPYRWQQPARPIVPKGPTLCMIVPAGSPGKTIKIDHPKVTGASIQVAVPKYAKVGQAMLVPIPDVAIASKVSVVTAGVISAETARINAKRSNAVNAAPVSVAVQVADPTPSNRTATIAVVKKAVPTTPDVSNAKTGWSTRAKVAAGGAAAAALGGGAFLAAYAATEAREGGSAAAPTDDGMAWYPDEAWDAYRDLPVGVASDGAVPVDDGMTCPEATDTFGELPVGEAGGEAALEDGGATMCDGAGGEDAGLPEDVGIGEDEAEWLADMCGLEDGFSGDGADAVADFVVDLF